jgi:hypothetical protein
MFRAKRELPAMAAAVARIAPVDATAAMKAVAGQIASADAGIEASSDDVAHAVIDNEIEHDAQKRAVGTAEPRPTGDYTRALLRK